MQNAWVYTRDHPNFRQKIDQALDRHIAPLARAFALRLIDSDECAPHGGPRVGTREQEVGTCGSQGFCGAQAAACYTCLHFQPWLQAPHAKMLQWFLAERERAASAGAGEHVLAATHRSIEGVQAVIAACAAHQAERAGEGDQS